MKRFATSLLLAAVLLLVGRADVLAQDTYDQAPSVPVIFTFESLEADTNFFNASYGGTPEDDTDRPRLELSELLSGNPFGIEPVEGEGAMLVDWQLFSDQSWGGSMGLVHALPDTTETYYDFSDFTDIHVNYYVLTPADPAATFRLKLHDASLGIGTAASSETEDWYSEDGGLYQAQPGWNEFTMPLTDLGLPGQSVPANGFSRPGCATGGDPTQQSGCWSGLLGNEQLDLDKISAFTFEITGPQFGAQFDSTTAGIIVFDKMYVSGVRYDLLSGFESSPGGWDNGGGASSRNIVTDDAVEGDGAMQFDYHVMGGEDWGGSADVQILPAAFPNLTSRTHLSIFYKTLEPVTKAADDDNARIVFKLFDNSTGTEREEWHYTVTDVLGDTTGSWQRLLIPLNENALTLPSWVPQGDATLDLDAIVEIQFQVLVDAGDDVQGSVLFDRFTSYGSRQTDFEGPAAVQNFMVTSSDFTNLVSWEDVPGEDGERYDVYYSLAPITDIEAEGIYSVATGVAEGTEVLIHPITAPIDDQEVTYYYAIVATDEVGNLGEVVATDAVTNTAKGIPTIAMAPPAGFAADGDVGEWAGFTPFSLSPEGDLGHVAAGFTITDAADLSADMYLAVDDDALYFAFDVTDDVYVPVPDDASERWNYDGAEVYLGLYNETRPRHENQLSTGDDRDYKFYLYKQLIFRDGLDSIAEDGDGNYAFVETDKGYVIEGRLPYDDFVYDGSPVFTPQNGMRIPLDLVLMDNDEPGTANRTGILAFSNDNDDTSYLSPQYWAYTWIGDQMQVVVSNEYAGGVPTKFALDQNYPNPFNPATLIAYDLPQAGRVTLKVFNVLGQEVATLIDANQAAGRYELRFDARDLPSGTYFYQLRAGADVRVKKMLLVR